VILDRHPELFDNSEVDDLSLVLFFFYEKLKGEKSEWWPSLQITNLSELPYRWEESEI
jgi:hypothetical protein